MSKGPDLSRVSSLKVAGQDISIRRAKILAILALYMGRKGRASVPISDEARKLCKAPGSCTVHNGQN